jgi:hypothetical protein
MGAPARRPSRVLDEDEGMSLTEPPDDVGARP